MLISHERRFIFVKTRKTAGTSIELQLSPLMGPMDVVTPIGPEDEAQRVITGVFPRSHVVTEGLQPGFGMTDATAAEAFARRNRSHYAVRERFFNHMPAVQIRRTVGLSLWRAYHTFCVERIPFDRLLSYYHFRSASPRRDHVSFSDLIRADDPKLHNSAMYLGPSGKPVVDEVIPFHELQPRLAVTMRKVGIALDGEFPRAKARFRADRRHWSEVIGPADREYIARTFEREFEALGLSPEEAWRLDG